MSATPAFGMLAIPVCLEKLLAGSRATKVWIPISSRLFEGHIEYHQRDVLHTLTTCLPIYGPAVARAFSRKLWNSLKLEVSLP